MNDFQRRKTIWLIIIFSILVNVVAWIGPLAGGSPASPGPGFLIWGTAPLVVSLLMRAVTRDWSDLGIKPTIRKNTRWYLISLFALPVLMVLALLIGIRFSVISFSGFALGKFLQTTLTAFVVFFIFAIFEEVGWRGYLAPKLASLGVNRYLGYAITGIVWASWHLPYIQELTWVYSSEDLLTFLPRFYLTCFALSILFGEIRNVTGTFWSAVVMHAAGNSFGHPLSADFVTIAAGREYLGNISNGLFLIALAALLGIVINRWRQGPGSPSGRSAEKAVRAQAVRTKTGWE
jgi:membrane protease YdiL (CAAX protease family)